MIALIPIEPISEAHGGLIVEAFHRFYIDKCPEEWQAD